MKNLFYIILLFASVNSNAQKYITRDGHIDFYSHAPLEDIRSTNDQVAASLDIITGQLSFAVLMKSFEFEKALMQQHFNENYIESDEYPRASFKGDIVQLSDVNFEKPGDYKVRVKGKLTLHGVTQEIDVPGNLKISKKSIVAYSTFNLKPKDFNIKIPAAVKNNIAESIQVNIKVELTP